MSEVAVIRPGLIAYEHAWAMQQDIHKARVNGTGSDTVLLLEHPSVYTAGKRTEEWEKPRDGTPVVTTDRGGRITWHGPGQLVGYPILALPRPLDVVAYVRWVEELLIRVCAYFGLVADRIPGRSGVWVPADERGPDRKVAAVGIRVSRGVTMHGFALNCNPDLAAFDRIVPCGLTDAGVTSLSKELQREISINEVLPVVEDQLRDLLPTLLPPDNPTTHRAPEPMLTHST